MDTKTSLTADADARRDLMHARELPIESDGKSKRVFIVHGRNSALVSAVTAVIRSLGLEPVDFGQVRLSESFRGRYIGEVLDHAFNTAQAIVVICAGEERVRLRSQFAIPEDFPLRKECQPRPNVLIEIGMALRSHRDQVVIADFPPLRKISDLAGLVTVKFDGNENSFREALSARLSQAGCKVSHGPLPKPDILREAMAFRPLAPLFRANLPRAVLGLATAALMATSINLWIWPNWCAAACRQANERYASGTALWLQATAESRYLPLYRAALDEYYKALGLAPDNLVYRASVAATLNDLGQYDRTIAEMSSVTESTAFRSAPGEAGIWLMGEVAAASLMRGNESKASEYTDLAAAFRPHFRDWIRRQTDKYRRQDSLRHSPAPLAGAATTTDTTIPISPKQ